MWTKVKTPTANSTYTKLAVQWLNEVLCFVSSSVLADSFVLRNRQLLLAAKRFLMNFSSPVNSSGLPIY
jgi:hypothetical protein